jgi:hypothetical protein
MTTVTNLCTLEKKDYSLPPEEAVKVAYLQSKGDFNTWDYENKEVPLIRGEHSIACGDWCTPIAPASI